MINMAKSSEYWAERVEQLTIENIRTGDASLKELQRYYDRFAKETSEAIELYYARYGENNILEFAELLQKADKRQLDALWQDWNLFVKHHPQYAELQDVRRSFYQYTRLKALNADVQLKLLKLQEDEQRIIADALSKTAHNTHDKVKKMLAGMNIDTNNIQGLSDDMVRHFMNLKWTQDKNFSERIWDNNKKLVDYVHQTIKESIIRGESYQQMAKMLDLKFDVGMRNAKRLVHTESAFMQEEVIFLQYEECNVKEYEFLALMDSKTSDLCRPLNTKTFKVKEAQTGLNKPPMHANCRSTTIPIPPKR